MDRDSARICACVALRSECCATSCLMPQMYNLCVQLSVDARTCASIFEVMYVCMLALLARQFR
jgi:hypothetical protein